MCAPLRRCEGASVCMCHQMGATTRNFCATTKSVYDTHTRTHAAVAPYWCEMCFRSGAMNVRTMPAEGEGVHGREGCNIKLTESRVTLIRAGASSTCERVRTHAQTCWSHIWVSATFLYIGIHTIFARMMDGGAFGLEGGWCGVGARARKGLFDD